MPQHWAYVEVYQREEIQFSTKNQFSKWWILMIINLIFNFPRSSRQNDKILFFSHKTNDVRRKSTKFTKTCGETVRLTFWMHKIRLMLCVVVCSNKISVQCSCRQSISLPRSEASKFRKCSLLIPFEEGSTCFCPKSA